MLPLKIAVTFGSWVCLCMQTDMQKC
uniref:Uncharacterized protein n=1 Tax=Arundo donax TaxID=35708 RepID=A0A0A8Z5A5_ARUDO